MAISFKRYIDITSGVGAGTTVAGRDLIGRLFTTNPLVPTDTVVELESAADVSSLFGSDSEEYRRAAFYFGFISKIQEKARKISFVRYTPEAVAATLRGSFALPALAQLQEITDGSFSLSLDGNKKEITGRDFSTAASYADVAGIIESGIRAVDSAPVWADASVTFDSRTRSFILSVGTVGAMEIQAAGDAASGTPIAAVIRWSAASGSIVSNGYDATNVTDSLDKSADKSNNFGSFLFMVDMSLEDMQQAANFAHLSNVGFMYCQGVTTSNMTGVYEELKDYDGVALTELNPGLPNEYHDMAPMILLATTNYGRLNGTQNYMFQQLGLTPTVTDNAKANQLDALQVNYYGRTQQAGQQIDFYQRGSLLGSISSMNVYANEMWMKDRAGADIMTLFLALPKISANEVGRGQILSCLQNLIEMALKNGSISVGKPLGFTQKAFITQITGDENAWVQVQQGGWWLDAWVQEFQNKGKTEYKITYLLIYSKGDVVNKVEGTHTLI